MSVGRHMNTCVDALCICSHGSEVRSLQLPFLHPLSSSTLPRSFLLPVLCGAITARTWLFPPLCSAFPILSLLLLAARHGAVPVFIPKHIMVHTTQHMARVYATEAHT